MNWLAHAGRDVRHAFRMIARMPGLAAVVIVSIGVGIGVNTVVFSWIQAVLFKPLPGVSGAASFHAVEPRTDAGLYPGVSWREYGDLRERLRSVRDIIAFRMLPLYIGQGGQVERAYGLLVSDNYFSAPQRRAGSCGPTKLNERALSRWPSFRTVSGRLATAAPPAQSGRRFASTAGTSRSSASRHADSRERSSV